VDSPRRKITIRLDSAHDGEKLDHVVAHAAAISRRVARTWIAAGRVSVNGKQVRIQTRPVRAGAEVSIEPEATAAVVAPRLELEVLAIDRYLVAINKPAGLLSEHDRFGSPSLEELLPAMLRARGERDRVWLVHRLDAGTSGVIVVARTPMAVKALSEQFHDGKARKQYLALCCGRLEGERLIEAPIGRALRTRHEVRADGKPAATRIVSLDANDTASLVRAEPRTGRTHQIRVHLAHLGHPLWGDRLYGGPAYTPGASAEPIARPMLHAARLALAHPKTGAPLVFEATPPVDFLALTVRLGLRPAPTSKEAS
jgi:23S rRNA pseudouridine1911/1915/1917 synthase